MRVVALAVAMALTLTTVACSEGQSRERVTWRYVAEQIVLDWGSESEHKVVAVRSDDDWEAFWHIVYGDQPQGEFEVEFRAKAESAVDLRREMAVAYFPGLWPRPDHRVEDLAIEGVSRSADDVFLEVEWIPKCGQIGKYECDSDQKWHMTIIAIPRAELSDSPNFVAIDQFGTRLTGPGLPPSPTPLPTATPTPTIPAQFDQAALRAVVEDSGLEAAEFIIGNGAWRTENGQRVAADYKIFVTQGGAMYQVTVDLTGAAHITQRPE